MKSSNSLSKYWIKALALAAAGVLSINSASAQIYTVDTPNANVFEYPSSGGATSNSPFITLPGSGSSLALYDGDLYVAQNDNSDNDVLEYNATTGAKVAGFSITGLSDPLNLAISGSNLYVASAGAFGGSSGNDNGTVGVYDATTGIGHNILTGLNETRGLAVYNGNLYVGSFGSNTISEYNALTGVQNLSFSITGLNDPGNIVITGGDLFVTNVGAGTVGEYDASTGMAINASLITGLTNPDGLALTPSGDLLVANYTNNGAVAEYDTSGNRLSANYLTGTSYTSAIVDAPEPSSWALIALGFGTLMMVSRLRRLA
jgi:hypothetical protein